MQLKQLSPNIGFHPIDIVGSSTFGKNPKIMASRTFNMFMSDGWLLSYAGYKQEVPIVDDGEGRGFFNSIKSDSMIAVINEFAYSITLYSINPDGERFYNVRQIGELMTNSGDVFIDENNVNQVAICDQLNMYIWNSVTNDFQIAELPEGFVPGYVAFQDGRFIAPNTTTDRWALSQVGDGLNWFWGASGEPVLGAIQTKANFGVATVPFPGRGNLLLVMGQTVSELWSDVGASIFPYQKSTSVNYDYGCLNAATIATSEEFIAWLGSNEKSEPVIMVASGSDIQTISTDGINNKLQKLNNPQKSVGFFVKILGHLIYTLTFYDPKDNFTLMYDFTTQKFFDLTDEDQNSFIARHVVFFHGEYYFISLRDGNIYLLSSDISTYSYGSSDQGNLITFDIPRIRICSNFRLPDSSRFIVPMLTFTLQQGNDPNNTFNNANGYDPRVSLSVSRDGGITFGSDSDYEINTYGNYTNIVKWWKLGACNDFVPQIRFQGMGEFNAFDGVIGVSM